MNLYLSGTIIKEKAEVICLRLSTHFMPQTAGIISSRITVYRTASGALRSVCYVSDSSNKEVVNVQHNCQVCSSVTSMKTSRASAQMLYPTLSTTLLTCSSFLLQQSLFNESLGE
jgi:hypothetical protein